jgi:hypothetical protein
MSNSSARRRCKPVVAVRLWMEVSLVANVDVFQLNIQRLDGLIERLLRAGCMIVWCI